MTENPDLEVKDNHRTKSSFKTSRDLILVKCAQLKYLFFTRWKIWQDARFLLFCLCVAGIVQGMIFTNVVISSIERRFGYDSTQSGIIAGSYDMGSLIAVIPVTYFGGRPGASKPKVIALGMAVIGTGSLIFSLPHFTASRYVDLIALPTTTESDNDVFNLTTLTSKSVDGNLTDNEPLSNRICQLVVDLDEDELSKSGACDTSARDDRLSTNRELHNYKYVFILAQLLHGIGGSAITTLGTTLLDESVKKRVAPVYIGIFETSFVLGPAIGYVVGGKLLSIFTEFYATDEASLNLISTLTPTSPQWVGAWWLGFLLIVVLAYIVAVIMSFFPANMSTAQEAAIEHTKGVVVANAVEDNNNHEFVNRCDYGSLKDMPRAILSLLKNKTYICISIGAALDAFLLAGMAAFMPKYLEYQFGLTSGQAAMLVGAIIVPAGAGGTLLGGYLLKRFNMGRKRCLQFYIICQIVILPLYFGFLFNCPTQPFAGINLDPNGVGLQLEATCNQGCQCNVNPAASDPSAVTSPFYEPVCHLTSGTTYFSACMAGCSATTAFGHANKTVFHTCSCLPTRSAAMNVSDDFVISGVCPSDCNHIYFSALLFLNILFTFVATMPGLVASLRSVEHVQRSLALGLQTILLRGLGTVPGPVVFGIVIDQTCLLWQTTVGHQECDGLDTADSAKGSCRLYDNVPMSENVMAIIMAWRFVGAIFFVLALYFSKSSPIKDEIHAAEEGKGNPVES